MDIIEKQQFSIYYWLKSIVPSVPLNPTAVTNEFPDENLALPTVSIININVGGKPFELGGCELDRAFWRIDVFAQDIGTRNHLAYLVYNALKSPTVPVYDYDEGFPPTDSPSELGHLIVTSRLLNHVHVFEQLVEKLYWRTSITFYTYYETS